MFEITLLNLLNGKTFVKTFDSPYLMRKFLNKVKYSKKIKWISIKKW